MIEKQNSIDSIYIFFRSYRKNLIISMYALFLQIPFVWVDGSWCLGRFYFNKQLAFLCYYSFARKRTSLANFKKKLEKLQNNQQ